MDGSFLAAMDRRIFDLMNVYSDSEIDSGDGAAGVGALKQAGGLRLRKACPTEQLERLSSRALFVIGWWLMVAFKAVEGVTVRTATATRNEVRGE